MQSFEAPHCKKILSGHSKSVERRDMIRNDRTRKVLLDNDLVWMFDFVQNTQKSQVLLLDF